LILLSEPGFLGLKDEHDRYAELKNDPSSLHYDVTSNNERNENNNGEKIIFLFSDTRT